MATLKSLASTKLQSKRLTKKGKRLTVVVRLPEKMVSEPKGFFR